MQRSRAGYFRLPESAGYPRVVAPLLGRRALPPAPAAAAALPPRRSRAVDCGLGAAAAWRRPPALPPPDLVGLSRVGGARRSSEQGAEALRVVVAAAAAPLEAGDVGEAVAAAAEAALRTRGKLLADRTPRRDVREPPLPPLTPERSWAQEGRPVLPRLTGQPARGGGGGWKEGSGPAGLRAAAAAEQQPRRDVEGWRQRRCTRPRSGAAARDPQLSGDFMQWLQVTVLHQCLKEAAVMFSLKKR